MNEDSGGICTLSNNKDTKLDQNITILYLQKNSLHSVGRRTVFSVDGLGFP